MTLKMKKIKRLFSLFSEKLENVLIIIMSTFFMGVLLISMIETFVSPIECSKYILNQTFPFIYVGILLAFVFLIKLLSDYNTKKEIRKIQDREKYFSEKIQESLKKLRKYKYT